MNISQLEYGKGFALEQMLNDMYFLNIKTSRLHSEEIGSTYFLFKTFDDLNNAFKEHLEKIRESRPNIMFEDFTQKDQCFVYIAKQSWDLDIVTTSKLSEKEIKHLENCYSPWGGRGVVREFTKPK